jgi:hypothetical protein
MKDEWLKITISSYSNELLKELYIELKKVGNMKKPYYANKSIKLKELFNMSNQKYWLDQYHEIKFELETEILYRISIDLF